MSDQKQVPEKEPAPQTEAPEKKEKAPAYVPPATREKRQQSVFKYITILFAAAFLLMLLTFVMEKRQNEQVVDSLNESVTGLRESLTNIQSAQDIYEENMELIQKVDQLQTENDSLKAQQEENQATVDNQEKAIQALDWFWQVNEAYATGKYSKARSLIQEFETTGLVSYLPKESVTDNGRFSPADRYAEIVSSLS